MSFWAVCVAGSEAAVAEALAVTVPSEDPLSDVAFIMVDSSFLFSIEGELGTNSLEPEVGLPLVGERTMEPVLEADGCSSVCLAAERKK